MPNSSTYRVGMLGTLVFGAVFFGWVPRGHAGGLQEMEEALEMEEVMSVDPSRPEPSPRLAEATDSSNLSSDGQPRRRRRRRKVDSEAVDLSSMDSSSSSSATRSSDSNSLKETKPVGPHGPSLFDPHFSVYFDLLLAYQPGKAGFSFLNFHPLLLMEIVPSPDIMFSFEVNPSPRYYELDYQIAQWFQLRVGKIWMPFDDMNPHNIFGGTVDASRIRLGSVYYLPDVWTDLGIGAKFTLMDTKDTLLELNTYVVNGFPAGGSDPFAPPGVTTIYPNFADLPVTLSDNNDDKALGGKLHAWFSRKFGIGFSVYRGRYSNQTDPFYAITMLGVDTQLRLGKTEFKLGASYMIVGIPDQINGGDTTMHRQGEYFEFSQKFGVDDRWRFVLRTGYLDTDDRITDANDVLTVGGGIRYTMGVLQLSLESYQDLKIVSVKQGYNFTFGRVVVQL
jgi:hypothetical protein